MGNFTPEILWQDIQFAFRQLYRSPNFAFGAILTLALGVGANSAVFSAVYALLLRSLPFQNVNQIVTIYETNPQIAGGAEVTFPDYLDWRAQQKSFAEMAAYSVAPPNTLSLVTSGGSEQVQRVLASGSFFSVLGVSPLIGRTFSEQDDTPAGNHVAVISAAAWQRYFGRDPSVLGRRVDLNGANYAIIGVLRPGAALPSDGEFWLPLSLLDKENQNSRVWHTLVVLGRLRPGGALAEAKADMQTVAARLESAYAATNRNVGVRVIPLREQMVGAFRPALLGLMGSVALILIIACANVANLLMVRAMSNRREFAVRQALGATRLRLFTQSFAMALILCLGGGALGTAVAALTLPLLRIALAHTAGMDVSLIQSIALNPFVLLVTLSVCCFAAICFGLLPVLGTSFRLSDSMHPGDRGSTDKQNRIRGVLIAGEIAIAVVVLFLSTVIGRSFQKLLAVDPGFRTDHLLSFEVTLPKPTYEDQTPATNHFYEQLMDRIQQVPGVLSAASTISIPLSPSHVMTRFLIDGASPPPAGAFPMAQIRYVSPEFFSTLGLALKQGRIFDRKEIENHSDLFVVNEAFAAHYLAGRNPLNSSIIVGILGLHPEKVPVIGVVSNARDLGLETEPQPEVYLPGFGTHEVLLVRAATEPQVIVPNIRNVVHELNPNQPIYHVQTIDHVLSDSLAFQKMTAILLGIFAFLAVSLAAVGMYGVLAYSVTLRRREIGIRIAVGAQRQEILRLFLAQAAILTAGGLVAGLAGGLACARLLRSLLFETSPIDPNAALMTIGMVLLITAFAVAIPARAATSIDPTEALRSE